MKKISPLIMLASLLSTASLAWTTYSVVDLLGIGPMGLTVAASLDIVWGAILYAEYKRIPLMGSRRATSIVGWSALAAVVALLVWHGKTLEGSVVAGEMITAEGAMAVAAAGPLLPLGAKIVWLLAIGRHLNPAALTPEEEDELAAKERKTAKETRVAGIDQAQRQAQAEARQQAQEQARQEQARQESAEHQAEMDRLAAQAERDRKRHEIEMINLRAEAEREREQRRIRAEEELDAARSKNDVELTRLEGMTEIEIRRTELMRDLESRQPLVIQGQVVRPDLNTVPARQRREAVAMNVMGLSEAQQAKKRLAALWYQAADSDPELTKAAFSRSIGTTPVELSRATKMFGPEDVTEEDVAAS